MNSFSQLTEIEDAIVRYVQSKRVSKDKLTKEFTSKTYSKDTVINMISVLENGRSYIKLSKNKYSKQMVHFLDEPHNDDDWERRYEMTPLGTAYLARSSANFTSYSNITNSNIAHESPNAVQSIDISELQVDVQEKIAEFDTAVSHKDGTAMKKAIGYILDKSVDVGIALVTGALIR